jgi:hypothetical protein
MPNSTHNKSGQDRDYLETLTIFLHHSEIYIIFQPLMYRNVPRTKEVFNVIGELDVPLIDGFDSCELRFLYLINHNLTYSNHPGHHKKVQQRCKPSPSS